MKKLIISCLILAINSYSHATIYNVNSEIQKPLDSLKKTTIDPVCKMKVKAGSSKKASFEKGIYSFCSESCKKLFLNDPKKYIKK